MNARLEHLLLAVALGLAACGESPESLLERGLALERERGGFITGTVEVDGHPVAYMERPGGGATVVLLHGFASEKEAWLRFARFIPARYRVIAFDLPGHGRSAKRGDVTHDVDYLAATIATALHDLEDRPVHIAGNSLGGMIALLYTRTHPERVRSLGLFAAAGVDPQETSEFERMLEEGDNPLIVDSVEDFERLMELIFADPPPMPRPVAEVLTRRFIAHAEFHHKVWDDIWSRRQEVTGLLGGVHVPVFIVWGEQDRILHPSSVEVFVRGLPKAEVYLFAETGHSPMMERPGRAGGLYRDFVERHPD